ncbi:MAG: MBL fold metallo-hydrolase [Chitinophagaceae bacterium]
MDRRKFIQQSAMGLGALTLLPAVPFRSDEWKSALIRRDVYLFTEKGGAIAFLKNKDATVIVDSQFPEQAGHLLTELRKTQPNPFDLLINTHHHPDHSAGNIAFKGQIKHVLAHSNSKTNQEQLALANNTEDQQLYPDQTFGDTWCQDFGKEKICLHYFGPAHTNGDALVHFEKADVVHMGDLLCNRRYPNVDRKAGASVENWMLVLDRAYNVFDRRTIFVCGHGLDGQQLTVGREFLREMKFFFENLFVVVKQDILAGRTREEILARSSIPGMDEWKDTAGFIRVNLEAVYLELTAGT